MSVWDALVGQGAVAAQLREAAQHARGQELGRAMTHAWLITGPPGSGRSTAARAFAAALECTGETPGCGECAACRQVLADQHVDVTVVATERVNITMDQVEALLGLALRAPAAGHWRVILVEDADRMLERTSNVLLKAIEEPPERTAWILCTPSAADVLPTIRSRCRVLTLVVPSPAEVAQLLVDEGGVDPQRALLAARITQCHIGMARYLARHPQAWQQRRQVIEGMAGVRTVADALAQAGALVARVKEQAEESAEAQDLRERQELLDEFGAEADAAGAQRAARSQLSALAQRQKGRATRRQRDALDRALVDLLSFYRDVYVAQTGAGVEPVNADVERLVAQVAAASSPAQSVARMDAVALARQRLAANCAPLLTMEALAVSLRPNAHGRVA